MIQKASARSIWHIPRHGENENESLERMARNGSVTRDPTEKQTNREHRSVGSAIKANFFICRKYLKRSGTVDYQNTSWQCKECRMPLCKLHHALISKLVGLKHALHSTPRIRPSHCRMQWEVLSKHSQRNCKSILALR
jgi:hypothetical protein